MLSRRVARRQSCRSASPSKSPNARFVFPRSIASNIAVSLPALNDGFGFLQWGVATPSWDAAAEEMRKLRPFWRDDRIVQWPARESRRRLVPAEGARAVSPRERPAEGAGGALPRA